jgi:hypothetical protein
VDHFRQDDLEVMDTLQEKFIPEEAITDAAGRVRWLQTIKRPLIGQTGLADQVLGVATDITERRQIEAALRQSEWRQRLLAELGELLRGIEEPDMLLSAIVQTIGEHLQVRRCLFTIAPQPGLRWKPVTLWSIAMPSSILGPPIFMKMSMGAIESGPTLPCRCCAAGVGSLPYG